MGIQESISSKLEDFLEDITVTKHAYARIFSAKMKIAWKRQFIVSGEEIIMINVYRWPVSIFF